MGFLRTLFGPNKEEIWRQLCDQIGGEYVKGGFWKADKLLVTVGPWTITLDTYTVSSGNSSTTYTRMRAPYVNADGFRFTIYRKSIFSGLGKLFGMQDIEIGEPLFDDEFIVKGSDESRVRELFANARLRELIREQPNIHFEIKDDEGWFGASFPEGVDELYFRVVGVIREIDRLKQLYELFAVALHQLCHMGSAYEDDPDLVL